MIDDHGKMRKGERAVFANVTDKRGVTTGKGGGNDKCMCQHKSVM